MKPLMIAVCMLCGIIFVLLIKIGEMPNVPLTTEQQIARDHQRDVKAFTEMHEASVTQFTYYTSDLIPHDATNVKAGSRGWASFVWNGGCFVAFQETQNNAGIASTEMVVCDTAVDIREFPTEPANERGPIEAEY